MADTPPAESKSRCSLIIEKPHLAKIRFQVGFRLDSTTCGEALGEV
jgi:hypothetical protein